MAVIITIFDSATGIVLGSSHFGKFAEAHDLLRSTRQAGLQWRAHFPAPMNMRSRAN